jgi:hypothetical protein
MTKKQVKAKPRSERIYPQTERMFSKNFHMNMEKHEGKCFVPWEDFIELKKRYVWMFKRYRKAVEDKNGITS